REIVALGLRFNPTGSFTSIEPIVTESLPASGSDGAIPQIVDGRGWQTSIVLVNTGPKPASFSLKFIQPDGAPLSLAVAGTGSVTEVADAIPVGGSRVIGTSGQATDISQGWGQIVVTSGSIAGTAIL